jgi:hypothetical protein
LKDYLLKDAAKMLGINYSTAKTILRIFRLEKRVEKKNAEQERQLKSFLKCYKQKKEDKEDSIEEESQVTQTNTGSEETPGAGKHLESLNASLSQLYSDINKCFEHIKQNQSLIGILFNTLQGVSNQTEAAYYSKFFSKNNFSAFKSGHESSLLSYYL